MAKQREIRVLWDQDILIVMCIPLHIPRAKRSVWLNLDLIRLLSDYLWDIVYFPRCDPWILLEIRRFNDYGRILRDAGLTGKEIRGDHSGLLPLETLGYTKYKDMLIKCGIPVSNKIPWWDFRWMIRTIISSSSPLGPWLSEEIGRVSSTKG